MQIGVAATAPMGAASHIGGLLLGVPPDECQGQAYCPSWSGGKRKGAGRRGIPASGPVAPAAMPEMASQAYC